MFFTFHRTMASVAEPGPMTACWVPATCANYCQSMTTSRDNSGCCKIQRPAVSAPRAAAVSDGTSFQDCEGQHRMSAQTSFGIAVSKVTSFNPPGGRLSRGPYQMRDDVHGVAEQPASQQAGGFDSATHNSEWEHAAKLCFRRPSTMSAREKRSAR